MSPKRGAIYAAIIVALAVGYWRLHRHDKKIDQQIQSTVLPAADVAKVIVNPRRHTVTTVTKSGVTATFLPSSGASIELGKSGNVVVTTRKWGTTLNPYLGFALGSDIRGRAALGLNLFYVQRWEFGGGLLLSSDIHDSRAYIGVGYNAYDNWLVTVGIDNRKTAHIVVGLKF